MSALVWVLLGVIALVAVGYIAAIVFAAVIVHMDCHGEMRGEIGWRDVGPARTSASPQASSERAALSPTRAPQPSAVPVPRQ